MITEDQTAIIEFLGSPSTHSGTAVDRIETHSAVVFLAGPLAYKLKRAVRFDYLDFSTIERRRAFCEAEVRLNRRTAPTLYRDVIAVSRRADGSLSLGGEGDVVDWLVVMNRFLQEALFDRLAGAGRLELDLMPPLAEAIAAFHSAAERRVDRGGRAAMAWVIDGNAAGFEEYGADCLDSTLRQHVTQASRVELARRGALLDARRNEGFVRQCHGDLHLRNIVLLDGHPTLFDGVEFNDDISCTDVLYDLAFLLMDLWRRRLHRHASSLWNRYLAETDDLSGISLMPLFHSCRAAVRGKTSATAARLQHDSARRSELQTLAREYLAMAESLLRPPPPSLVAIGGFSGSGKSTLARRLAPAIGAMPGAIVHRSDEIRKRLCGVPLLQRLGAEGYLPAVSGRVYSTLADRASRTILGGHSAIVDAVYSRPTDRHAIEAVARKVSVPFVGIWLDAPEPMLVERVAERTNDPSDADAAVIQMQRLEDAGEIGWHRLDASMPFEVVLRNSISYLQERVGTSLSASPGEEQ
jgi:aminoglycoside phosphotransferase family enzyme/predicted kinase